MELHERIRYLRKNVLHLTQQEFGNRLGVSRDVIKNLELGILARPEQKDPLFRLITKEFNVDYIWLTTGKGDPISKLDDASLAQIDSIMTGENEFHKNLIKMIATLDDDAISRIEEQLRLLLDKQNKKADD